MSQINKTCYLYTVSKYKYSPVAALQIDWFITNIGLVFLLQGGVEKPHMDWLVDDRAKGIREKMDTFCEEREEWCEERDSLSRPHLLLRWQKCRSEKPLIKRAMSSAPLRSQTTSSHLYCAPLALRLPSHYTGGQPLPFLCVCVLIWSEQETGLISWSGRVLLSVIVSWKWQKRYDGGAMMFSFFSFLYDHKREVLL